MKHVIACIDESRMANAVTQYATWSAKQLQTPLTLFHVLDEMRYPVNSDMTGNIGLRKPRVAARRTSRTR